MTSLPLAIAASPSITAEALLLTTSAASAPVARATSSDICACLDPRRPVARSSSRSLYPCAARSIASFASSLSGARPRFVCSTTPVALITWRGHSADIDAARSPMAAISSCNSGALPPDEISLLASARHSLMSSTTKLRECALTISVTRSSDSRRSTLGSDLYAEVMSHISRT